MRLCVEGNIGSGKSAALEALRAAYPEVPCFPEPVAEWRELLEGYYASPAAWALPLSLKVLLSFEAPRAEARCIVERSPLSCRHVFSQVRYSEGLLQSSEWDTLKQVHDALAWQPDVVFFIDTPPPECLDRIAARGRAYEKAIDEDYLRRLDRQYANMLRFFCSAPVETFDGRAPPEELHAAVVRRAAEYLSADA